MATSVDLELFRRSVPAQIKLVLLALLSCVLLLLDAHTRYLEPLRQTLSVGLYPFQRAVMLPRDAVMLVQDYTSAARLLQQESDALRRQRIELAQVVSNAAQLVTENGQLRRLLSVIEQRPEQPAVVVEVLYEPVTAYRRRLVFNKGSRDGIEPGMPIIDEGGLVGQVIRVTPFSAEAAVLNDPSLAVPVQLLRNGLRLIAFGSSVPGKVEVRYFSSDADIRDGDVLVTSGVGGQFPAGIAVGTVESVERDSASGFARAVAQPSSYPERYRHFLILKVPAPTLGATEAPTSPESQEGKHAQKPTQ
jgi:rod shape-determining protein MreC